MSAARIHKDGVSLSVKAKPGGKRNAILKIENDQLKVSVTAAPEGGKANVAIIELLSDGFGIARSHIELLSGDTRREKVFLLHGLTLPAIEALLAQLA